MGIVREGMPLGEAWVEKYPLSQKSSHRSLYFAVTSPLIPDEADWGRIVRE